MRQAIVVPERANERWSMDLADTLADGRTFRTLNVVDGFTREALAIEVDGSIQRSDELRSPRSFECPVHKLCGGATEASLGEGHRSSGVQVSAQHRADSIRPVRHLDKIGDRSSVFEFAWIHR